MKVTKVANNKERKITLVSFETDDKTEITIYATGTTNQKNSKKTKKRSHRVNWTHRPPTPGELQKAVKQFYAITSK
ncbi:MAG: hypothetical protein U9Q38_10045 [Thermodesulfobacteriota bacterium]|nr:hypothetical protein [Thermodesulfobacteriota bacterium]